MSRLNHHPVCAFGAATPPGQEGRSLFFMLHPGFAFASVIHPFREPAAVVGVAVHTKQQQSFLCPHPNIPFLACPVILLPPLAGSFPRPARRRDRPEKSMERDPPRCTAAQLHRRFQRRTKPPQRQRRKRRRCARRRLHRIEPSNPKRIRAMRIQHLRRSDIVLSHHVRDPCQRNGRKNLHRRGARSAWLLAPRSRWGGGDEQIPRNHISVPAPGCA